MKVYLVTYSYFDDFEIHSVWLDEAKAVRQCEKLKQIEFVAHRGPEYWSVETWAVEDA